MQTLLVAMGALTLSAASYDIAPTSQLSLVVEKTGLLRGKKHLFVFPKFQGTLDYDPARPEAAQVRLKIESASAQCKDEWVSMKDLKKIQETALVDMLAAEKYPYLNFRSNSVRVLGAGRFEVIGTLAIREVTRDITVAVSLDAPDPNHLKLTGEAKVVLTQFSLKPPTAVLGAIGTRDEMTFSFSLTATESKR